MIDEEAWPFRGGHEVMAHLFLKAAVARGHEVRVGTGSPGPDKIDGIEYVRLDHPSRVAKEEDTDLRVSLIPKVKPLIDEYRPDAVFAGGFWVQEVVKGAKRAKVPVAFLKHNAWAEPPNADLVIYDSRFVKDSVKYHGRGVVLHPPAQWTPREPRSEGRGCYTMLNLCFTKGVHLFHALAKALPDRRFIGVEGGHGKQERYPKPNIKYAKKGEYPIETILDKWTGRSSCRRSTSPSGSSASRPNASGSR